MKIKICSSFVLIALLSGCATMSKDECLRADWYLKGVDDATQGYPLERVIEHGKDCARVDVTPNMVEYRKGHAKGARLYCVPNKGYSEGRQGAAYNGICPSDLEPPFLRAYQDGQELFNVQRNIENLEGQIANNRQTIDSDYYQIEQLKRDLVYSNDGNERRFKMHQLDEFEDEIRRLSRESERAVRELDLYRNDYRILEDKHYRMGYIH